MEIEKYIDHSLLKANILRSDVELLCKEAIEHQFAAVCITPYFVSQAAKMLEDHPINVATVIGFPLGFESTTAKVEEIKRALDMGVDELDVVVNIAAVKNADWNFVKNDIETVTRACHMKGKVLKVIFETSLLEYEELEKLCEFCTELEVDYVKTSTGFEGGASVQIVRKMRELLPKEIKIKASGGIRNYKDAFDLIKAGADRLGTSSGTEILASAANV